MLFEKMRWNSSNSIAQIKKFYVIEYDWIEKALQKITVWEVLLIEIRNKKILLHTLWPSTCFKSNAQLLLEDFCRS